MDLRIGCKMLTENLGRYGDFVSSTTYFIFIRLLICFPLIVIYNGFILRRDHLAVLLELNNLLISLLVDFK